MKRIILAAIATISCNAVLAADDFTPYVNASVGAAKLEYKSGGASLSDDNTGFQVALGYRGTPTLGLDGFELGYTTFGTGIIGSGTTAASARPRAIHLALTGSWKVAPQFAITGKVGIANTRTRLTARAGSLAASANNPDTSAVVGIGASYAVTPKIAAIAQYQHFGKVVKDGGSRLNGQIATVGVRYDF